MLVCINELCILCHAKLVYFVKCYIFLLHSLCHFSEKCCVLLKVGVMVINMAWVSFHVVIWMGLGSLLSGCGALWKVMCSVVIKSGGMSAVLKSSPTVISSIAKVGKKSLIFIMKVQEQCDNTFSFSCYI